MRRRPPCGTREVADAQAGRVARESEPSSATGKCSSNPYPRTRGSEHAEARADEGKILRDSRGLPGRRTPCAGESKTCSDSWRNCSSNALVRRTRRSSCGGPTAAEAAAHRAAQRERAAEEGARGTHCPKPDAAEHARCGRRRARELELEGRDARGQEPREEPRGRPSAQEEHEGPGTEQRHGRERSARGGRRSHTFAARTGSSSSSSRRGSTIS